MYNFIICNKITNEIISSGACSSKEDLVLQPLPKGAIIIEGKVNQKTQKIVDGKVIDKTPEEIEAEKPPEPKSILIEKQPARITNEQWQDVLNRLGELDGNR